MKPDAKDPVHRFMVTNNRTGKIQYQGYIDTNVRGIVVDAFRDRRGLWFKTIDGSIIALDTTNFSIQVTE